MAAVNFEHVGTWATVTWEFLGLISSWSRPIYRLVVAQWCHITSNTLVIFVTGNGLTPVRCKAIYGTSDGWSQCRSDRKEITHQWNSHQNTESSVNAIALQWRHDGRDGVSNNQLHDYFLNLLFRHNSKENIKAPRHWPLCGEFTRGGWIPRTNGQQRGKCFHLMTSSWIQLEHVKDYSIAAGITLVVVACIISQGDFSGSVVGNVGKGTLK